MGQLPIYLAGAEIVVLAYIGRASLRGAGHPLCSIPKRTDNSGYLILSTLLEFPNGN
jgi:hypothetical protein